MMWQLFSDWCAPWANQILVTPEQERIDGPSAVFVRLAAALPPQRGGGPSSLLQMMLLFGGAGQVDGHFFLCVLLFLHKLLLLLRLPGLAAAASLRRDAERVGARGVGRRRTRTLLGHFNRLFVHSWEERGGDRDSVQSVTWHCHNVHYI